MKKNRLLYILPIALGMVACEPEFEDVEFNGGSADFSSVVTVGNSLTAGFQNSALRRDKQEVSMSAMIAEKMQQVGGGAFTQPLMDPGVGLGSSLNAEFGLFLRADCEGEVGPTPAPIASQGQLDQLQPSNFVGSQGPFNNVGVPGAKSFHLVAPGYGNPAGLQSTPPTANPFYVRFANPNNFQETVIQAAMRANPTFFTLWIGNNDVLGYALAGGNDPTETITSTATFRGDYNQIISTLTSSGAKGVVANIPDITSIPYFTTIPIGTDQISDANVDALNAAYGAYNAGLDQAAADTSNALTKSFTQEMADRRKIVFRKGQINTWVVLDPSLTDLTPVNPNLRSLRQIRPGELLTLTTSGDSLSCFKLGTQIAINPSNHLTLAEIQSIENAVSAYNNVIKSAADANNLAFVDANARLKELANTGIKVNGVDFSGDFISGGAFSLDGVHPSTRGYAIIANDFISAINNKYGANIPEVNVTSYSNVEVTP